MGARLHRSFSVRLFAVWFAALIAFPVTAPFSIVDGQDITGQAADAAGPAHALPSGDISTAQPAQDDGAAVVSLESSSLEQARLCALFTLPSYDAAVRIGMAFEAPLRGAPARHTPVRIPLRI